METHVSVNTTKTRPEIEARLAALRSRRGLHEVMGRGVRNSLRAHFLRKNAAPNKKGWPKSNWYSRLRKVTEVARVDDAGAVVTVADPSAALRWRGGVVRPKSAKRLAIPLQAAAKAAGRPREGNLTDLYVVVIRNRAFLAQVEGTRLKKGFGIRGAKRATTGRLRLMYLLVASARIPADPRVLPPAGTLEAAARTEAELYLSKTGKGVGA